MNAFLVLKRNADTEYHHQIFFIIDGIDEYEGDHYELFELFSQVAGFESIKILLSSRPIPACVQAFSRFPKLRLQDLTHDDITYYVEDKLGGDSLMQKFEQAQEGATQQLVEGITSKASGVFLWVCDFRSGGFPLSPIPVVKSISRPEDELPPSFVLASFYMMVELVSTHGHAELTLILFLGYSGG